MTLVKKSFKRLLSLALSIIIVFSSVPIIGLIAFAKVEANDDSKIFINVPETIYLKPTIGKATESQYFVENTIDTATGKVSTLAVADKTSATVTFECDDAESVSVSVNRATVTSDPALNAVQTLADASRTWNVTKISLTGGGVSEGEISQLTWTFRVKMKNGGAEDYNAYTTLYSPYLSPVGAAINEITDVSGDKEIADIDSQIAWVSGIHGYDVASANDAIKPGEGSQETAMDPKPTRMLYYPNFDIAGKHWVPLLGDVKKQIDNKSQVTDYLSQTSNNVSNDKTIAVFSVRDATDSKGITQISPTATLTVDASRYDNLNKIPNLKIGFAITDLDMVTGYAYNVAEYTNHTDNSKSDYVDYVNKYEEDNASLFDHELKFTWWNVIEENDKIDGTYLPVDEDKPGDIDKKLTEVNDRTIVFYENPWIKNITTKNKVDTFVFSGNSLAYKNYNFDIFDSHLDDHSFLHSYVNLQVTNVCKKELRDKYYEFLSSGYSCAEADAYTDTKNITTLLKDAANVLGDPTASADKVNKAFNNLNKAVTPINDTATAHHLAVVNELNADGSSKGLKIRETELEGSDDSKTVTAKQSVIYSSNTYEHYTYKGRKETQLDNVTAESVEELDETETSVAYNYWNVNNHKDEYFYYQAEDQKLTVDIEKGALEALGLNDATRSKEITGSYGETFTIPAPTREGFAFAGWSLKKGDGTTQNIPPASNGSYIYKFNDTDVTLSTVWTMDNGKFEKQSEVIDFGLPIEFDPISASPFGSIKAENEKAKICAIREAPKVSPAASGVDGGGLPPAGIELDESFKEGGYPRAKIDGGNIGGTFEIASDNEKNSVIKYVPKAAITEASDEIDYAIEFTSATGNKSYAYGSITVLPATSVYYEDNVGNSEGGDNSSLIEFKNGATPESAVNTRHNAHGNVTEAHNVGEWITLGNKDALGDVDPLKPDTADKEDNYGESNKDYEASSAENLYSLGSSHYVEVSRYNNPSSAYAGGDGGAWPTAKFTFSGTGFDVVSVIGSSTGVVQVDIYKGSEESDSPMQSMLVDTFYGYTFTDGKWTVSEESSGALYQIPVINKSDLPFDTYTVVVTPKYSKAFDHKGSDYYGFYLDAIRIYNPAGFDDDTTETIYAQDGERSLYHTSIRPLILDSDAFNDDSLKTGGWFIPGKESGTYQDYVDYGPKNEVYLSENQAISFHIKTNVEEPWNNIAKIKVSMHAPNSSDYRGGGTPVTSFTMGNGEETPQNVDISTPTILYYTFNAEFFKNQNNWQSSGDGYYTTVKPFVITNTGTGMLALCDVKVTTGNKDLTVADSKIQFASSPESYRQAYNIVSKAADKDLSKTGYYLPDAFAAAPETDKALRNHDVTITVKTSLSAARVTVDGKDAKFIKEENGEKLWSYTFTTQKKSGVEKLEIVTYSKLGNPSDPITVEVDVESRLERLVFNLKHLVEMILEFIEIFS